MIAATIDLQGLVRTQERLDRAANLDYHPLMREWETLLLDGNREGLLSGLDRFNRPMPTTQRQRDPKLSAKYGSGPPLVPNREASRAIVYARTTSGQVDSDTWAAILYWQDFTSIDGLEILPMHAHPGPRARYPRRDVIGVRPDDVAMAGKLAGAFVRRMLRRVI